MGLYHGTTERNLPSILANGIVPRPDNQPGNWKGEISEPGFAYLTTAHALWYACVPCRGRNRPVILELDIDRIATISLHPDEDYLKQEASERYRGDHVDDPDWSTDPRKQRDKWEDSLDSLGNLAVLGTIPPNAITRYAVLSNNRALWDDWYPGKLARLIWCYQDYKDFLRGSLAFMFDQAPQYRGRKQAFMRDHKWFSEQHRHIKWSLVKLVREVVVVDEPRSILCADDPPSLPPR